MYTLARRGRPRLTFAGSLSHVKSDNMDHVLHVNPLPDELFSVEVTFRLYMN